MAASRDDLPIEWHPAALLQSSSTKEDLALIVLNQPLNDLRTLKQLWHRSAFRVAADGGANHLYASNQRALTSQREEGVDESSVLKDLQVIIGDLDSLTPTSESYFESVAQSLDIVHDSDQYSTDFTKAVRHIRKVKGEPIDIVAMGGLGGRVDQGLSQLHHLYMFQQSERYDEGRVYLVSGRSLTFLLKAGHHRIWVREDRSRQRDGVEEDGAIEEVFDKYAGIIPVKEPSVITLRGFEWDVTDWPTEFGGQMSTSNHVLPESKYVEVKASKDVLFTIALNRRDDEDEGKGED